MSTDKDSYEGYHLVIKGILHQYRYDIVKDISGVVVVEHLKGLVQKERPHYHIWVPYSSCIGGSTSRDGIKKVIRDHYTALNSTLDWNRNANAYYSFTPHSSFDNWLNYTFVSCKDCKEPKLHVWNREGAPPDRIEPLDPLQALVMEAGAADAAAPAGVNVTYVTNHITNPPHTKSKSKSRAVLFYEHCLDKYTGTDGPYSLDSIHDDYVEWSAFEYDDFQIIRNVRSTWYKLNENHKSYRSTILNEHKNKMLTRYI